MGEWRNHYNRKERRCYVQVFYYDAKADPAEGISPRLRSEVSDAVERVLFAWHTDERLQEASLQIWCRIAKPIPNAPQNGDCQSIKKLIGAWMTE